MYLWRANNTEMVELWAVVAEVPTYEVSTLGRVRHGERVLDPAPQKTGYVSVTLSLGARHKKVCRLVHTLVAKAFLPNLDELPIVNHKNWKPEDNRVDNLEWVSIKGNRNAWTPGKAPGKRGRKVVQMSQTGVHLQVWDSARAAECGVPGTQNSSIARCCKGTLLHCAGFQWAYFDDVEPPIPGEEWKNIEIKGKTWKVSSIGRVRTHTGYTTYGAEGAAYLTINGMYVHVLVARAFCMKGNDDTVVNHMDGNKRNNNSSNLEWCTQSENVRHAFDTELIPAGCSNKLKKAVIQILPDGTTRSYESIIDADRKTGVNQNDIRLCCQFKRNTAGKFRWAYAPKPLTEPIAELIGPTVVEIMSLPIADRAAEVADDDPVWAQLEAELLQPRMRITEDDMVWLSLGRQLASMFFDLVL